MAKVLQTVASSIVTYASVFQIAYCDFLELSKAEAWNQIFADFVHSVRNFMTEMLRKQKVHYILHLVQCMPESFNSDVRIQNISRLLAETSLLISLRLSTSTLFVKAVVTTTRWKVVIKVYMTFTKFQRRVCDQFLFISLLDGKVQQFKAVVLELVHTGDYIKLQPPFCELKYGQLLSTIESETGHTSLYKVLSP
ncbi:hypothetical protein EMCRGX_G017141 [Ephydatia muelleri]